MMIGGAILFGLAMCFTSCEGALDDIFGEWDKPSANASGESTPSSDPTPSGGGETPADPLATPLTLEVLTAGTIVVNNPKSGMQYSTDGGVTKTTMTATTTIPTTGELAVGTKVEFYGTAPRYNGTKFGGTADVKVYGNIMSLLSPTGFADNKELTADHTFYQLFFSYTHLKDASNLFLPAETLTSSCYDQMFQNCNSLTAAPALPAESLANYCYFGMFEGCSSLTTAPKLPATTLTTQCYYGMFQNCTSLTNAYVKAAYVNTVYECADMFDGCTAAGTKTLHTTNASKGSWDTAITNESWAGWTTANDWTD
jgi:hypothetical protein